MKIDEIKINVIGWTVGDGSGHDGYHAEDYFDANGAYRGPDEHGIEPIFHMRTLKLKDVCNVAGSAAQSFLQSPPAPLGQFGNVRTVQISDIPDTATDAEVLKAWRETTDISWLANDGEYTRHSYRFSEIGGGRIIRG